MSIQKWANYPKKLTWPQKQPQISLSDTWNIKRQGRNSFILLNTVRNLISKEISRNDILFSNKFVEN